MRANAKNCLLHENLTYFLQMKKFGFLLKCMPILFLKILKVLVFSQTYI
jgi:hypothetical protein